MDPRQEDFEAISVNGATTNMSEASKPLLRRSSSADQDDRWGEIESSPEFSRFKSSALFLGMILGVFIQFSTVGAKTILFQIWGDNVAQEGLVSFSLLWSIASLAMTVLVLAFLRKIVSTAAYTRMALNGSSSSSSNKECVKELIRNVECRFVVGALIGVCVTSTAHVQIIYCSAAILLAVWCKLVTSCLHAKEEKDTTYDSSQPNKQLI